MLSQLHQGVGGWVTNFVQIKGCPSISDAARFRWVGIRAKCNDTCDGYEASCNVEVYPQYPDLDPDVNGQNFTWAMSPVYNSNATTAGFLSIGSNPSATGTITVAETASPFFLAGTNCHLRTADKAELSRIE